MANLWTADASGLTSAAGPVNADDGNWTADGFIASGGKAFISSVPQFDHRLAGYALIIASAFTAATAGMVTPYRGNTSAQQYVDQPQAVYLQTVAFAPIPPATTGSEFLIRIRRRGRR